MFKKSIHWIEFTTFGDIDQTIDELKFYHDHDLLKMDRGMDFYHKTYLGAFGCKILFSDNRADHHVILPGNWCDSLQPAQIECLIAWVQDNGGKFTRIDLAMDDYARSITPDKVLASFANSEAVTHCVKINDPSQYKYSKDGLSKDGSTVYIGSRHSARMLRIYDKMVESNGEQDCIRWELVLKDEQANYAVRNILDNPHFTWESILVSLVDFREVKQQIKSRRPRLYWFHYLVNDIKKAEYATTKIVNTIEKMEKWIRKTVAPTLSALFAAKGGDYDILTNLCVAGRIKWKSQHRLAVEDYLQTGNLSCNPGH